MTPDPYALVAEGWPADGPHTPERLAAAMAVLSGLVRYANHATRAGRTAVGSAPEGYAALANLVGAAGALNQLCRQLGTWCHELADDPTLRHDAHSGISEAGERAAMSAARSLVLASAAADDLYQSLSAAQQQLSHLYHEEDT
jgi:hypothetical protein